MAGIIERFNDNAVDNFIDSLLQTVTATSQWSIEALALGGSHGRQQVDTYSDIDVFVQTSASNLPAFLSDTMTDFIRSVASPLMIHGPVFVTGYGYSYTVLYRSYPICQYNVNNWDTLAPNAMCGLPARILYDSTGRYTEFRRSCQNIGIDTVKVIKDAQTWFWLRCLFVWKDIRRGDMWLAVRHIGELRTQLCLLERATRNRFPASLDLRVPEKSLERDLGTEWCSTLAPTITSETPQDLARCLSFCLDWAQQQLTKYFVIEDIEPFAEFETGLTIAQSIRNEIHATFGDIT